MSYRELPSDSPPKRTVLDFFKDIKKGIDVINQDDRERDQLADSSRLARTHNYKKPVFTVNDMESTFLTLDKSLLYVGDNSSFQKRITLILAIQWISFSFMVNTMAFFFQSPIFHCYLSNTDSYYTCPTSTACSLGPDHYRTVQSSSQLSIAEEFELYCGRSGDIYQAESLFFLGGFLSGYLLSFISQKIGRRPVILAALALSIVSMVVCALSPSFTVFRYSYFCAGCFLFGYQTEVYLYISEISAVRFKTISINMLTMVWAGTPIFLPLLGFIPNWRICFIIFASVWFMTLPFAYSCFLESPRFLLSRKCYSQVRNIFQKISITNNRPPYNFRLAEEMQLENEGYLRLQQTERGQSKESKQQRRYNYFDLFRFKSLRRPTLVLMYLWAFRFIIYFGVNLALQSVLKSGFWLTFAISLSSVSQVIGSFGLPIIRFLSSQQYSSIEIMRRVVLLLSVALALLWLPTIKGVCTDLQMSTSACYQIILMVFLVCCVKFFNSILFGVLITYSPEAFPTSVRSLGYGFTLTFGRMSTFMAPFFIDYARSFYEHRNALCFLAPFGFFGLYLCLFMPDSSNISENLIEEEQERLREREVQMMSFSHTNRLKVGRSETI